jgi:3-dehydroquinate synthase
VNEAKTKPLILDVGVPSGDLSYQVRVGEGLLSRLGHEILRATSDVRRVALVSDTNVMPLHGPAATQSLEDVELQVLPLSVPAGERSKSPERMLELVGRLVDGGFDRRDLVVALGGGVVGDLAGLVAAMFMRGIQLVQCPTSLLAQVDASVGGKVAVDLPTGKNLLGTFHFPSTVLIDTSLLATLPDEELSCGLAEMLKHGALFSAEHFHQLVDQADAMYERDRAVLPRLVATSVALKAACVSRDPLEKAAGGKGRVLLNLGHTIGHAIEAASNFEMRHGDAVGLGLRAAARLSAAKGLCGPDLEARIVGALERLRLPTNLDAWIGTGAGVGGERGRAVERALERDKKRSGATVTYIGLADIGDPRTFTLAVREILPLLRSRSGG